MIFEWIKRVLMGAFGTPESEMPWVGAARALDGILAAIEAHDAQEASKQADGKEAA